MTKPIVNAAQQSSAGLKLIGQLWLSEVDQETIVLLNQPEVRASFSALGGSIPESNPLTDVQTIEQLAVDYCQLLVGPQGHVPPIQSIWMDRQYQSDSAASMQQYFNLLPAYVPPAGIIDHLGVQLDYAATLLAASADQPAARKILEQFAAEHLTWCRPFLQRVQQQSQTDFYRGLVNVSRASLQAMEIY